ncbi:hypothetical protein MHYP_G00026150 [Metynnis hypsauchen]
MVWQHRPRKCVLASGGSRVNVVNMVSSCSQCLGDKAYTSMAPVVSRLANLYGMRCWQSENHISIPISAPHILPAGRVRAAAGVRWLRNLNLST